MRKNWLANWLTDGLRVDRIMLDDILEKIENARKRLDELPKGTLVYKNIKGSKQPYLQWTENGHSKCFYIRKDDRDFIFAQLEERAEVKDELERLRAYYKKMKHLAVQYPHMVYQGIAVGEQSFEAMMVNRSFYVDKTSFIQKWWEDSAQTTLFTRPRRFGKTLTLNMMNCFFSQRYQGREDLFQDLDIWKNVEYRSLQGTYPTIFLTFGSVKANNYETAEYMFCHILQTLYLEHEWLMKSEKLSESEKVRFRNNLSRLMNDEAKVCIYAVADLCSLLRTEFGKNVLIFIDEYDTPLQEAYIGGYWEELLSLIRNFFNATLKLNPYYEKGILTGITRVSKESVFSDMNHLSVHTVTDSSYASLFGFTEEEVELALECQDSDEFERVKECYDGFRFGDGVHIYNPWSIINYLYRRTFQAFWVHTSGNGIVSKLFLQSDSSVKEDLQLLLKGECIHKTFNENIAFTELEQDKEAIWPFLLATGYLTAENVRHDLYTECDLSITNKETMYLFETIVQGWFKTCSVDYRGFCKVLLTDDVEHMNKFLNYVLQNMVSYFDAGKKSSDKTPERFYHGLVLGLLVDLQDQYEITSNRESGFGRYDVMMEPRDLSKDAILMEFKVIDEAHEVDLEETAQNALYQIKEKRYETTLLAKGMRPEQIRRYGFAFSGKEVLIQKG